LAYCLKLYDTNNKNGRHSSSHELFTLTFCHK
jgi:hypothetical protein